MARRFPKCANSPAIFTWQEHITFTGYLRGDDLLAALSTFDIGIIPDPVNEYNDKISMNKVFEYSAFGSADGRLRSIGDPAAPWHDRRYADDSRRRRVSHAPV